MLDDDDGRNIIHDAPYCNNDDSSRWRLRSIRENTSEDDDDDYYNGKRITNIMLAQLSEIGVIIHVRVSKSVDAQSGGGEEEEQQMRTQYTTIK